MCRAAVQLKSVRNRRWTPENPMNIGLVQLGHLGQLFCKKLTFWRTTLFFETRVREEASMHFFDVAGNSK
jgi:hypothetical protein